MGVHIYLHAEMKLLTHAHMFIIILLIAYYYNYHENSGIDLY